MMDYSSSAKKDGQVEMIVSKSIVGIIKAQAPKLDFNDDPKVFMAVPVWNYQVEAIQIWNITQATIRTKIRELANDPEWGDPRNLRYQSKEGR